MLRVVIISLSVSILVGCAGTPDGPSTSSPAMQYEHRHAASDDLFSTASDVVNRLGVSRQFSPTLIRDALMAEYDDWAGTPYRLGGESIRGVDCSALVQQVFNKAFALALPRTTKGQVLEGRRIEPDSLRAGDLVFFRPSGGYRHVGIYLGDDHFLHASTSRGVIISSMDNIFWKRHFWQARRPLERTELAQRAVQRSNES